jgi:hypothetical protein
MRIWGYICIILGRGLGRLSGLDTACFGDGCRVCLTACTPLHGCCVCVGAGEEEYDWKECIENCLVCSTDMQCMP